MQIPCIFIDQIVIWGEGNGLWEGRNGHLDINRMALSPITMLKLLLFTGLVPRLPLTFR